MRKCRGIAASARQLEPPGPNRNVVNSAPRRGSLLGESIRSTFLFAMPTWQEGVGRLVDFGDALTEYNRTSTPEAADARAIAQDWLAVGDELRAAMANFRP